MLASIQTVEPSPFNSKHMIKNFQAECREAARVDRKEEIQFLERIYNRGAGLFGIPRRHPAIAHQIKKLKYAK